MISEIKLEKLIVTPLGENCYIYHDSKDALVFDPGGDYPVIKDYLDKSNLTVKMILCTHGHFDHTGAVAELKRDSGAGMMIHKSDLDLLNQGPIHAKMYGMEGYIIPKADKFLSHGDIIKFLGKELKVIHTPGHSEGSVCFFIESDGILISGDTLFRESIGRTDLPGGDFSEIASSIKGELYTLPDNTQVFPGHGSATSIGYEKRNNPFVF